MTITDYSYLLFLFGLLLILGAGIYLLRRSKRPWKIHDFFKDFKRKIIMTMSLGFVFFLIYLGIVQLSIFVVKEWGTDLIFFAHRYPVEAVYGGLCVFASMSLSIYLVRMVVKYVYLTRGKDG